MLRKALTVSILTITSMLTIPSAARAGGAGDCQSEWLKFKSFFDQNGPKIVKGICLAFNKNDAAAAERCVQDYERAKAQVDATIVKSNGMAGDSSWKVGPRGLGEGQWATGTLLAQRTFAGPPVMSDSYRLTVERTGGKAKNTMRGTVCFLDKDGQAVGAPQPFDFSVSRSSARFERNFTGVAGLTPVILLQKPAGFNGHQYRIRGQSGGEPAIVSAARKAKR